jgi:signal peptidase I
MHFGALGGLIGAALERWGGKGRQRRRLHKESKLLIREAKRALRKFGYRAPERAQNEVRAALAELDRLVVAKEKDPDTLSSALNALDKKLDEHLSFARKSTLREYAESIAVAVLIALFLRAFVVEAFKIPSGSMIPTLQVGDHIFVNKFLYGVRIPWTNIKIGSDYRKPRRGEVIVFIYPKEPDKDFIKRIVAVEGDTVEIRDNAVVVNGQPVARHHVDGECEYTDYKEDQERWVQEQCDEWDESVPAADYQTYYNRHGEVRSWPAVRVPPGSVFVMGDNRDNSHDSRYWGTVPFELIKGKAMIIWWSNGDPGGLRGVRLRRMFHLVQ